MGEARALSRCRRRPIAARALRLAATAVALGGCIGAAAESFEVSVGCRDGLANGAYELRSADGRLRVAGALAKGRRTGTFVFWNEQGARIAVVPYDDERRVGTVALWYAPRLAGTQGARKLEAPYAGGRRHGLTRSWHDNGRPRSEVEYEHGTLAGARAWQRDGTELAPDEARARAARDEAADDATLARLDALVANNVPACEADSPRSDAARSHAASCALTLAGKLG